MNFLFILNTFYPNIGGVENATFEICKRLKERSHNVYVLTTDKTNYSPHNEKLPFWEEINGIQIFRVRFGLRILGIPLKAIYLAKKFKINYIYITDFWGFSALLLKRMFRIPFVYVLNGFNPICPQGTLFSTELCRGFELVKCFKKCHQFSLRFLFTLFITRLLLLEAQPVIAVSKAVQNAYLYYWGRIPIKLMYYGVDLEKFKPYQIPASRAPYHLSATDKCILFFGRLIKERGVQEFLSYFNRVLEKIKCKLIIVGGGPTLLDIKARINELKLQTNVTVTGYLRNQRLVEIINFADIVILPILFPEPLSLVVLESMACAKPVISFKLGGVKELIADRNTGLLIPPQDWTQFINGIIQLLADKELCVKFGMAARQKIEQSFNWNQFMDKFLQELNK
jgi:glycosyltransferase involved in cell wall biosynthesis